MKNLKKFRTPKGYLSWTQLNLFERSKNAYVDTYLRGLNGFENEAMRVGKRLANRLETDEQTDENIIEHLAIFLPSYPKREFPISVDFEEIPLFGKLDGFNPWNKKMGEYKTGKRWTQALVDKSGQITFYTTLVWLKYGKLPSQIDLHWARTETKNNRIVLTGEIRTFRTQRTMADIILFRGRIKRAWEGIITLTKEYEQENRSPLA